MTARIPLANKAPWNETDFICDTCDNRGRVEIAAYLDMHGDMQDWPDGATPIPTVPCPDCGSAEE